MAEQHLQKKRRKYQTSVEAKEANDTAGRLARHDETKKRSAAAQLQPRAEKKRKSKPKEGDGEGNNTQRNEDANSTLNPRIVTDNYLLANVGFAHVLAFYSAITAPFLRICGSCVELVKSDQASLKPYNPRGDLFAPLCNAAGECEIIPESVATNPESGVVCVWLCRRCDRSLLKKQVPKFCRASGFQIAPIPAELALLNRMEARLIGLGVSFTTCVNLYNDGQEFTCGNSIKYWNNPVDTVLDLPRPIRKCGIVYLKTNNNHTGEFFTVRPDLLRRALCWLIDNNPLFKHVRISEENLAALREFDVDTDLPSIPLTNEEAQELAVQQNKCRGEHEFRVLDTDGERIDNNDNGENEHNVPPGSASIDTSLQRCHACSNTGDLCEACSSTGIHEPAVSRSSREMYPSDPFDDLVESFELERNDSDTQTELEKIVETANFTCDLLNTL